MPQVAPLRPDEPKRVGRYRLTGRITGITGSPAYLGRATDGDRVTLTLFAPERTPDSAVRDRFTAEARAARRVPPFCVARILDAGLEHDQAYLVSEYVAGPLLSEVVAAAGPRDGEQLAALAAGLATGLAAVHQAGLVHGEFGPAHVVLGAEGPRVTGFAITPPYGAATPAADMLAWALTVLFAATGQRVADRSQLLALPEPLRGVVASCATPEPAARPTARQALVRLLGQEHPPAGVLAEGSRRAAKAALPAAAEPPPGPRPAEPVRPAAAGPGRRLGGGGGRLPAGDRGRGAGGAGRRLRPPGACGQPGLGQPAGRLAHGVGAPPVAGARRDAAGRGGRHLVRVRAAGQRQHRHLRPARRQLAERHDHVLRHLVCLLGQPQADRGGAPDVHDAPGNRGRGLPERRSDAPAAARRGAEVQLQGRVQPRRHRHPDQAVALAARRLRQQPSGQYS